MQVGHPGLGDAHRCGFLLDTPGPRPVAHGCARSLRNVPMQDCHADESVGAGPGPTGPPIRETGADRRLRPVAAGGIDRLLVGRDAIGDGREVAAATTLPYRASAPMTGVASCTTRVAVATGRAVPDTSSPASASTTTAPTSPNAPAPAIAAATSTRRHQVGRAARSPTAQRETRLCNDGSTTLFGTCGTAVLTRGHLTVVRRERWPSRRPSADMPTSAAQSRIPLSAFATCALLKQQGTPIDGA